MSFRRRTPKVGKGSVHLLTLNRSQRSYITREERVLVTMSFTRVCLFAVFYIMMQKVHEIFLLEIVKPENKKRKGKLNFQCP